MIRRRALAWFVFCCALAAPGWAAAATQTLTGDAAVPTGAITDTADPVTDTVRDTTQRANESVDPVIDTVRETVKPVTDPVTDTVRDTVKPVAETLDPVTDTVRDTVKPVTDTVRDVVDPIRDTVGPVTDPDRTGTDTVRRPDRRPGQPSGGEPSTGRADGAQEGRGAPRATQTTPIAGTTRGFGNGGDPSPPIPAARAPRRPASTADAVVRAVVDASRRFSFPLSVAALVLGFLAVQGRIDARDPKLRPVEDEELMFV